MPHEYELSIITVNYNGLKDTCALIDTIPFNNNMEVIVVDNASSNNEATQLSQRYPQIKVIESKKNLGFAGGNNLGIREAKGKYLFLINNDTVFKEFNINILISRLESSPNIGMVCPKIRFAWGANLIQFAGYTPLSAITIRNHAIGNFEEDHGQYDTPQPTPYAHGAAMFLRRDSINKIGFMPECYFLYYEELDWSLMFYRSGYEIWYEPNFTIYHKESQTTGQNSPLRTYYLTRNRLLFVRRNWQTSMKYITYCYLIGIVSIRDIIKYGVLGKYNHLIATLKGINDFFTFNFKITT